MDQYLIIREETHDAVNELCRQAWDAGQRDMLAKCIAAVEAMPEPWPIAVPHALPKFSVLDALRALPNKP